MSAENSLSAYTRGKTTIKMSSDIYPFFFVGKTQSLFYLCLLMENIIQYKFKNICPETDHSLIGPVPSLTLLLTDQNKPCQSIRSRVDLPPARETRIDRYSHFHPLCLSSLLSFLFKITNSGSKRRRRKRIISLLFGFSRKKKKMRRQRTQGSRRSPNLRTRFQSGGRPSSPSSSPSKSFIEQIEEKEKQQEEEQDMKRDREEEEKGEMEIQRYETKEKGLKRKISSSSLTLNTLNVTEVPFDVYMHTTNKRTKLDPNLVKSYGMHDIDDYILEIMVHDLDLASFFKSRLVSRSFNKAVMNALTSSNVSTNSPVLLKFVKMPDESELQDVFFMEDSKCAYLYSNNRGKVKIYVYSLDKSRKEYILLTDTVHLYYVGQSTFFDHKVNKTYTLNDTAGMVTVSSDTLDREKCELYRLTTILEYNDPQFYSWGMVIQRDNIFTTLYYKEGKIEITHFDQFYRQDTQIVNILKPDLENRLVVLSKTNEKATKLDMFSLERGTMIKLYEIGTIPDGWSLRSMTLLLNKYEMVTFFHPKYALGKIYVFDVRGSQLLRYIPIRSHHLEKVSNRVVQVMSKDATILICNRESLLTLDLWTGKENYYDLKARGFDTSEEDVWRTQRPLMIATSYILIRPIL